MKRKTKIFMLIITLLTLLALLTFFLNNTDNEISIMVISGIIFGIIWLFLTKDIDNNIDNRYIISLYNISIINFCNIYYITYYCNKITSVYLWYFSYHSA